MTAVTRSEESTLRADRASRRPRGALMATEIKLPRLGQGMESGVIVRWLKQEGEAVAKGEPLYELDTDKVTQEVEAEVDGVLAKIVVAEGEVEVGATIAVIAEDGRRRAGGDRRTGGGERGGDRAARPRTARLRRPESASAAEHRRAAASLRRQSPPSRDAARTPAAQVAARRRARGSRRRPLARRIARERGVDLTSLQGTGPEGRILAEDVEKAPVGAPAAAAPAPRRAAPPAGEVEVVQLTSDPQDDRPAALRGVGRARLPARRLRRHDRDAGAARDARRAARRGRRRSRP